MYFHFSIGSEFNNDFAFEGEKINLFCGVTFHASVEPIKSELILYDASNVIIYEKQVFITNKPYGIEFGPTFMVNKSGIVAYACVWILTMQHGPVTMNSYEHKMIAIPTCSLFNREFYFGHQDN